MSKIIYFEKTTEVSRMAALTCCSGTQEAKARALKASLGYIIKQEPYRPAWAVQ